jgi:hypothetical protein
MCEYKYYTHHHCDHILSQSVKRCDTADLLNKDCEIQDPEFKYKVVPSNQSICSGEYDCAYLGRIEIEDTMDAWCASRLADQTAEVQQAHQQAYDTELAKHRAKNPPKAEAKHPKHPQQKHKKH